MRRTLSTTSRNHLFRALIAGFALCVFHSIASAHQLSEIVFVGSPEWAIVHPDSIRSDSLLIRRYAFKVSKASHAATRSNQTQKLELVDPPGTIINPMFLNCRRKGGETDFLVMHLPETVSLRSFSYGEWKPTIQIRTLADGESRSVQGEYIKGDLFTDFKDMEAADFIKLMTSTELLFEFGEKSDRGELLFAEKTGATKTRQLIRDVLPELAKANGAQRVQFLNTSQVLAACLHFKKTGRP